VKNICDTVFLIFIFNFVTVIHVTSLKYMKFDGLCECKQFLFEVIFCVLKM